MLGPLGNGFDLDVERPLLVGGGIGVAPFPFLSDALGSPPAILGFRSDWHAEAAALVPNAEVCIEPTYVTELLPDDRVDVLACGPEPMLAALRERAARGAARLGGADGVRLRRLLRLRGRDRRRARSGSASTGRCSVLLNASGCLDALTAPDVARSLDAFVTKTITPEPREGNPPVRIAETDSGMLNSIGLANPGRERFLAETLPRLRELGVPLWISVGGFSASEYAETCAALEDVEAIELNLSCPNVDEAPEGAAEIVAACRAATSLPLYAKLSPAAWDIAEVARARRGRGRRRALAREHAARARARRADAPSEARPRHRRLLRSRPEAGRPGGGLRLLGGRRSADRRHGRSDHRARCARADRGRRERRRARHDSLLRPRCAGPDPVGTCRRGGRPRPRRSPRRAPRRS